MDAILRIIEFLKENKLDYATMYGPLIDAYGKLNTININIFQSPRSFSEIHLFSVIGKIRNLGNDSFHFEKHCKGEIGGDVTTSF